MEPSLSDDPLARTSSTGPCSQSMSSRTSSMVMLLLSSLLRALEAEQVSPRMKAIVLHFKSGSQDQPHFLSDQKRV